MADFKLTDKQKLGMKVLTSNALHLMFFGGGRCVSGDTILDGNTRTISELAAAGEKVWVGTSFGAVPVGVPYLKGYSAMLRVITVSGKEIEVTPEHRFWNGVRWIAAKTLKPGSFLAVQLSEKNLPASSSEPSPLGLPGGVLRSNYTGPDLVDHCFGCRDRHDPPPRQVEASAPTSGASIPGEAERILQGQCRSSRASVSHESDNRIPRSFSHGPVDSPSGPASRRPSSTDDCFRPLFRLLFPDPFSSQTSLSSLGSRQGYQLSDMLYCLLQSGQPDLDSVRFRFFQLLDHDLCPTFDTPFVDGYELEEVLSIQPTAEKSYFNVEVPFFEQYFANGFLNHNSGKTFLICRAIAIRAMKAPGSRHLITRFRFNAVKQSIVLDTWPKMMRLCFPGIYAPIDKTDWYARFPNGSEVWFGGLDEKQRAEKILGMEFITIFFNEVSQISYNSRELVLTRLAQKCEVHMEGKPVTLLKPKVYYDENPPSKGHWSYKLFVKHIDPDTKKLLVNPENYASMQMNPKDNAENLTPEYLAQLDNLSARMRVRFRDGIFLDETEGALFDDMSIDKWRLLHSENVPDMVRVVIAVDPSGSGDVENATNDEIGIVAAGLGVDGIGYLLADITVKAGPGTWGKVVTDAYDRWEANCVVGEINFGGAMVNYVIQVSRPRTPFKEVTASRGKHVRAEPVAALVEAGRIRHAGYFPQLEEELCGFTVNGYIGEHSPNRADAYVWAFSELFGQIVNVKKRPKGRSLPFRPLDAGVGY